MSHRFLAIYLNDHLSGATVGVELARRTARENAGNSVGVFLSDSLLPEIVEDRRTLLRLMAALGVRPSHGKQLAGWALEKVGRLKPNGRVRGYSPLSRLLELEGLAAGIHAKQALWVSLAAALDPATAPGFDFDALAGRADSQRRRLEDHRRAAATAALQGAV
jgi:hypothetical protein